MEKECKFYLFENNAISELAEPLEADQTKLVINASDQYKFPDIDENSHYTYRLVISFLDSFEIVKVVSKNKNIFHVERGQEGTLPQKFPQGAKVALSLTAEILDQLQIYDIYDLSYIHVQAVESPIWEIRHKLGYYPNVVVYNSDFQKISKFQLEYEDENLLRIKFDSPQSGYAFLICDPLKVFERVKSAESELHKVLCSVEDLEKGLLNIFKELIKSVSDSKIRDALTFQGHGIEDFVYFVSGDYAPDGPVRIGVPGHKIHQIWAETIVADDGSFKDKLYANKIFACYVEADKIKVKELNAEKIFFDEEYGKKAQIDNIISTDIKADTVHARFFDGPAKCAYQFCEQKNLVFSGDTSGKVITDFSGKNINFNLTVRSVKGYEPSLVPKPNAFPIAKQNGKIDISWLEFPPKGLIYLDVVDFEVGTSGKPLEKSFDYTHWYNDYCQNVKQIPPDQFICIPIATFSLFRVANPKPQYEKGVPSFGHYSWVDYLCTPPVYKNNTGFKFSMKLGPAGYDREGGRHSYSTKGYCSFRIYVLGGPLDILFKCDKCRDLVGGAGGGDQYDWGNPPVIDDLRWNSDTFQSGGSYVATIIAHDPDNDIVAYDLRSEDRDVSIVQDSAQPNKFLVTFPNYDQQTQVTFTASVIDSKNNAANKDFTVNVGGTVQNHPPVIDSIEFDNSDNRFYKDSEYVAVINAHDPDNDPLVYELSANVPEIHITSLGGNRFRVNVPAQLSSDTVTFTARVSDPYDSTTKQRTITFFERPVQFYIKRMYFTDSNGNVKFSLQEQSTYQLHVEVVYEGDLSNVNVNVDVDNPAALDLDYLDIRILNQDTADFRFNARTSDVNTNTIVTVTATANDNANHSDTSQTSIEIFPKEEIRLAIQNIVIKDENGQIVEGSPNDPLYQGQQYDLFVDVEYTGQGDPSVVVNSNPDTPFVYKGIVNRSDNVRTYKFSFTAPNANEISVFITANDNLGNQDSKSRSFTIEDIQFPYDEHEIFFYSCGFYDSRNLRFVHGNQIFIVFYCNSNGNNDWAVNFTIEPSGDFQFTNLIDPSNPRGDVALVRIEEIPFVRFAEKNYTLRAEFYLKQKPKVKSIKTLNFRVQVFPYKTSYSSNPTACLASGTQNSYYISPSNALWFDLTAGTWSGPTSLVHPRTWGIALSGGPNNFAIFSLGANSGDVYCQAHSFGKDNVDPLYCASRTELPDMCRYMFSAEKVSFSSKTSTLLWDAGNIRNNNPDRKGIFIYFSGASVSAQSLGVQRISTHTIYWLSRGQLISNGEQKEETFLKTQLNSNSMGNIFLDRNDKLLFSNYQCDSDCVEYVFFFGGLSGLSYYRPYGISTDVEAVQCPSMVLSKFATMPHRRNLGAAGGTGFYASRTLLVGGVVKDLETSVSLSLFVDLFIHVSKTFVTVRDKNESEARFAFSACGFGPTQKLLVAGGVKYSPSRQNYPKECFTRHMTRHWKVYCIPNNVSATSGVEIEIGLIQNGNMPSNRNAAPMTSNRS